MAQKRLLKDFEHFISPATWQAAEEIVSAGGVKSIREIEKHFWVALVETEEGAYESEIMITPHRIKAYACECFTEGRKLMCPHVAAGLLKVRQFLEQKNEDRRARAAQKPPQELGRLTVQSVLEDVDPEALSNFVRDYARRDRDFALALKTWFAGSVADAENPYLLLLDSVTPRTDRGAIKEADLKRLRKALDGLDLQLSSALGEGNHRIGVQIAVAIVQKINPLLVKLEGNRREMPLYFVQTALNALLGIAEKTPVPEIRDQIWNVLFQVGLASDFGPELSPSAIRFLSGRCSEQEKYETVRRHFDDAPVPSARFILVLFLAALSERKMPEATLRILEDYRDKPDIIRRVIRDLYGMHYWMAVVQAGMYFLQEKIFVAPARREIEEIVLGSAEKSGQKSVQTAILAERYLAGGHPDLPARMKAIAGKQWPALRKKIIRSLEKNGDYRKIAAVLAAEPDFPALCEHLESVGDLSLLEIYVDRLLPEYRDFIQQRYRVLLVQYLQTHFGPPAAAHVRSVLKHLLSRGESEVVLKLVRELVSAFPDRPSLPEELAEIFPKKQKVRAGGDRKQF